MENLKYSSALNGRMSGNGGRGAGGAANDSDGPNGALTFAPGCSASTTGNGISPQGVDTGVSGRLALKPIARRKFELKPVVMVGIAAAVIGVLFVTWIAGRVFQESLLVRSIGLLLISPSLVLTGYTFLQNDDNLEPHQGTMLFVRSGLCALAFSLRQQQP